MCRSFLSRLVLIVFLVLPLAATPLAVAYDFRYAFDGAAIPNDKGLVFGRVKVIRGDKAVTWSNSLHAASPFSTGILHIFVLPSGTSTAKGYRLTKDGFFCWQLPPGVYTLSGFRLGHGSVYRGRIFATFKVPSTSAAFYIGTLKLVLKGGYEFSVEDEYSNDLERFKRDFPTITVEPVKALLELENES
jgi:hypothetical protein